MGQITKETIAMIRRTVNAGQVPSLTLWEYTQLAWIAERWITCNDEGPAKAPVEPVGERRQYFYKVFHCKARDADEPGCVCWHDEGTGPLVSEPERIKHWRTTPPPAPVLSDAEIEQAVKAARHPSRTLTPTDLARAIEQAIGRASRGAK